MFFLTAPIVELVFASMLVIMMVTGSLVALAVTRRKRREKYFRRLDELRERYNPVLAALIAGPVTYQEGLEALEAISGSDRIHVLERLLLASIPKPAQEPILQRLCEELGLVKVWQSQLAGERDRGPLGKALASRRRVRRQIERLGVLVRAAGARELRQDFGFATTSQRHREGRLIGEASLHPRARPGILRRIGRPSFVVRATSAQNLGIIGHRPSWPLLVRALGDANADVGCVAARSLAAIGGPDSFQALLDRLYAVTQNPSPQLSLRSLEMSLVSFPLDQAAQLLPWLEHPQGRIRFLAVDIIREMTERLATANEDFVLDNATFAPQLTDIFLGRLCFDDDSDVRARAAPVIAYLADPRAMPALCRLLEDPTWFVRLRATRALAQPKYKPNANLIAQRLTDAHWRVREAATQTLLALGEVGRQELFDKFLTTGDRYSKEQIAEAIQRAGLIPTLLTQYANDENYKEAVFSSKKLVQ